MPLTNIDGQRLGDSVFDKTAARNLVINGAATVAQRTTSSTGNTTSGVFAVDRFRTSFNNLGTWTISQSTDSPDGFANSLKVDCTVADASPSAGDYAAIFYSFEGQDLQFLDFGNSGAKATTLSFYVKSNKTGNASVELQQRDNSDKQVTFQYTINSANTWERKIINVPGDTAGVIANDTGVGMRIGWWLNSGSDYMGGAHRSTWTAEADTDRNVSNLGVGGSTSDEFLITGVQWEVGNTATPFEHRSFGQELNDCLRYYEKSYSYGVTPGTATENGSFSLRKSGQTSSITDICPRFAPKSNVPTIVIYSPDTGASGKLSSNGSDVTASGTRIGKKGFSISTNPSQGANLHVLAHYTADAEF